MAWWGDKKSVYPLTQGWSFNVSQSGVTGTRVYLDTTNSLTGITAQTLPNIGDPWDSDYPNCTCKTIDVSYLNDNPSCGQRFTCNYDSSAFVQAEQVAADDLPVGVEVAGQLTAFEPYTTDDSGTTTYYYDWDSDNADVKQPLFVHEGISTIKFTRVVKDIEQYVKTCMRYVAHINEGTFFSFPCEMVLFEGVNCFQFKNKMGNDRWKAELTFAVRNVTDNFGECGANGWNFVLRKDGQGWDKPKDANGNFLYETADFDALLNEGKLTKDENEFNKFPTT